MTVWVHSTCTATWRRKAEDGRYFNAEMIDLNFLSQLEDYVQGFGKLYGEFWVGLDKIHRLATSVDLRIDLIAFYGEKAYAQYEYFKIGDSRSSYALYFDSTVEC